MLARGKRFLGGGKRNQPKPVETQNLNTAESSNVIPVDTTSRRTHRGPTRSRRGQMEKRISQVRHAMPKNILRGRGYSLLKTPGNLRKLLASGSRLTTPRQLQRTKVRTPPDPDPRPMTRNKAAGPQASRDAKTEQDFDKLKRQINTIDSTNFKVKEGEINEIDALLAKPNPTASEFESALSNFRRTTGRLDKDTKDTLKPIYATMRQLKTSDPNLKAKINKYLKEQKQDKASNRIRMTKEAGADFAKKNYVKVMFAIVMLRDGEIEKAIEALA